MSLRRFAVLGGALAVSACQQPLLETTSARVAAQDYRYEADIRWTRYGIPHVKAGDRGSLGFGTAYAMATDGVCVIAVEAATAAGTLSTDLGVTPQHMASDIFHRAMLRDAFVERLKGAVGDEFVAFNDGFIAGYNRYLRDHAGQLPAACNDASWVRPLDESTYLRMLGAFAARYSLAQSVAYIANAAPPGEPVAQLPTDFSPPFDFGSNAIAVGGDLSTSGRGILFGNPHFPWHGPARFHMIHSTIPGELDVMGVSLLAVGLTVIGFNTDIAWTHTISTARRSTLYELTLHPDDPMRYRYGNGYRDIESRSISVGGQSHTLYFSHYGPLLVSRELPWSTEKAYAVRSSVLGSDQSVAAALEAYDGVYRATSVADIESAISREGVWLTNTIAADRHGNAFYADISATPNVDDAMLARCGVSVAGVPASVVVLNGAEPECEWRADPRSRIRGNLPADDMPRATARDYFTNSNNSYWLSNPERPLEGYPRIIGPERAVRTLRTRAGLTYFAETLDDDGKVSPEELQDLLYAHRHYGAELFLDDVLRLCDERNPSIAASCRILRDWDRSARVDSRGMQLWTEFWEGIRRIDVNTRYREAFDPNRPVATPSGLNVGDAAVREQVIAALKAAEEKLEEAGIAADAEWGTVQFAERNGERIPVPGGPGPHGVFSLINAGLTDGRGYTPIRSGNSYVQVVSWSEDGTLDARGILTYSQSPDPASPHYADQTRIYSEGGWLNLPFTEAEILADPNLRSITVRE